MIPEPGSLSHQLNAHFDELLGRADIAIANGAYGRAKLFVFRAMGVADAIDIVDDWNKKMLGGKL